MRVAALFVSVALVGALQLPAAPSARAPTTAAVRASMAMKAEPDGEKKKKSGIDFSGLAQLMAMGAGAPMLGDLKKVNFDKPEAEGGAALQFELEANNFFDEKGDCQKGKYFEDGWVDDGDAGPDFMSNLMSGGKLQREFDERRDAGKR